MEPRQKLCKDLAFWDIYEKSAKPLGFPILRLRCPYAGSDCKHREFHGGRMFCKSEVLEEEIRNGRKPEKPPAKAPEKKEGKVEEKVPEKKAA